MAIRNSKLKSQRPISMAMGLQILLQHLRRLMAIAMRGFSTISPTASHILTNQTMLKWIESYIPLATYTVYYQWACLFETFVGLRRTAWSWQIVRKILLQRYLQMETTWRLHHQAVKGTKFQEPLSFVPLQRVPRSAILSLATSNKRPRLGFSARTVEFDPGFWYACSQPQRIRGSPENRRGITRFKKYTEAWY